jgi:hypothetical protein
MSMTLHCPGAAAKMLCGDQDVTVCGIWINADMSVQYQVEWFYDGTVKTQWVYPVGLEFKSLENTKTIGFVSNGKGQ